MNCSNAIWNSSSPFQMAGVETYHSLSKVIEQEIDN